MAVCGLGVYWSTCYILLAILVEQIIQSGNPRNDTLSSLNTNSQKIDLSLYFKGLEIHWST